MPAGAHSSNFLLYIVVEPCAFGVPLQATAHESLQISKCKGSRPVRVTWAAQRAGRGDPLGSDVDVTLTVETVVHLGQALTLRENPYCCFVVTVTVHRAFIRE